MDAEENSADCETFVDAEVCRLFLVQRTTVLTVRLFVQRRTVLTVRLLWMQRRTVLTVRLFGFRGEQC